MAAAGSMREVVRLLHSTFAASTVPYPLPEEVLQSLDAFLYRRHETDYDAQRLHDELLSLYKKHVTGDKEKNSSFISALRRLRPALSGEACHRQWWELVVKPTIYSVGRKRNELEEARRFLQDILVFDPDEDKQGEYARLSKDFSKTLLEAYLSKTKAPSGSTDFISPEDDFVAGVLESILVKFGCRKPKEFFFAVDELFVRSQYRLQMLSLLSAFLRIQPPHLYTVMDTPFFEHLEKCLLIDTSTTAIQLAILNLVMLLPHVTGSLTADHHLAKLFLIYSRALCWDKYATLGDTNSVRTPNEQDDQGVQSDTDEDPLWEQLHGHEGHSDGAPDVLHYFTFLYGLFPLNFASFLRKPRKYLKGQNFPGAEDFELDPTLIHTRTEPLRRVHLLHPNMFTTTVEDELTENRWLKADAADVVTECLGLCVAMSSTLDDPGPPPSSELPPIPSSGSPDRQECGPGKDTNEQDVTSVAENSESRRNSQSTLTSPSAAMQQDGTLEASRKAKSLRTSPSPSPLLKGRIMQDSPTLPPIEQTPKHDLRSVPPLDVPHIQSPAERLDSIFASNRAPATEALQQPERQHKGMAALQREIMLLRNDLNFERYLKQQHVAHIAQLQRKHIGEARDAAETQNLIIANRTLKSRLAKANELYAQLKKETLTSRSQSKKWEAELSAKVKSYRDNLKARQENDEELQFQLQKSQQDCEMLRQIVKKAEEKQLQAEQKSRSLQYGLDDYSILRSDLEAAENKALASEHQRKELSALLAERDKLRDDLHVANMRLNSREAERERAIKDYEQHIEALELRVRDAEWTQSKPGELSPSAKRMIDSAVAVSNAKLQQLKGAHQRLSEQHTELEIKYLDLKAQVEMERGQPRGPGRYPLNGSTRDGNRSEHVSPTRAATPPHLAYMSGPVTMPVLPEQGERDGYIGVGHDGSRSGAVSPTTARSPSRKASTSTARPVRLESLHAKTADPTGFGQDYSSMRRPSLSHQFHHNPTSGLITAPATTAVTPAAAIGSSQSARSLDTESSNGANSTGNGNTDPNSTKKKSKDKASKPEVRYYGRGESRLQRYRSYVER
ncbi:hypothetical protein M011DRAFT_470611 [Sporormia fimetaria CBS 119925]|uniref:Hamartin n=1 Tax=Sporormia fimetaria CBS 119925 TaxID=1340428 RepID=A0A6A6V2V9_9PLEO|nr:hypothetical protein M011DRAFT_470611 [Sporormia fimetaria CBS 119925]